MKRERIYIMNFTHVYEQESFMRNRKIQWLDCTKILETNCYCSIKAEKELKKIIAPYKPQGIHFIDSGDYHYITKLWVDKIKFPYSLIIFDHHPDMQPALYNGVLSCGSWARDVLENDPFCKKIYLIGVADELMQNIEGIRNRNKLIYISERDLKEEEKKKMLANAVIRTPIYISIDKDVLSPKFAVTNWDQGSLSLKKIKELFQIIATKQKIIGIDICGECPSCISRSKEVEAEYTNDLCNTYLLETFLEAPLKTPSP